MSERHQHRLIPALRFRWLTPAYDRVVQFFHHLERPAKLQVLAEARRVLKPGGACRSPNRDVQAEQQRERAEQRDLPAAGGRHADEQRIAP